MSGPNELTQAVCAVLNVVEPGFVTTYGAVGRQLGISPRDAGRAVANVPDDVPWWRVVRADGTTAACRGGRAVELLASEGVPIRDGRVDLTRVREPDFRRPDPSPGVAADGSSTSP